jgi:malate synthase
MQDYPHLARYYADIQAGVPESKARKRMMAAVVKSKRNLPRKRHAGDWLPQDKTAYRKARTRRRHKKPKSEMQLRSEQARRNSP